MGDDSMSHMSMNWMWMPTDPPSAARLLAWHPQPIPLTLILALLFAALYAAGVVRLHQRGIAWPVGRTIWFGLGIASAVLMVGTGINGYGMSLFSVHMVQHMVLSMATPILLLLGRPTTLALRALPASSWPRHALVWLLHSKLAAVFSSPFYTIPAYIFSLYGLYFTPLFDLLMSTWLGHEFMLFHFVGIGMLLYWPILGLDPSPHTPSHALGFVESLLPLPFHAFFAVTVMGAKELLVQTFAHPPMSWHIDPVADQQLGGGLAWAISEIPGLAVAIVIAVLWARESAREGRRHDRAEDRSHDAQLAAYNDWMASLGDEVDGWDTTTGNRSTTRRSATNRSTTGS